MGSEPAPRAGGGGAEMSSLKCQTGRSQGPSEEPCQSPYLPLTASRCGCTAVDSLVARATRPRTRPTHTAPAAAPSVSKAMHARGRPPPAPPPRADATRGPGAPPGGRKGEESGRRARTAPGAAEMRPSRLLPERFSPPRLTLLIAQNASRLPASPQWQTHK